MALWQDVSLATRVEEKIISLGEKNKKILLLVSLKEMAIPYLALKRSNSNFDSIFVFYYPFLSCTMISIC